MEKDLEQRKKELSEEQLDALMKEHQQQAEFLERNMELEKQRQVNSLADKIVERKRKRAAALARKHEAEIAKELLKQKEERKTLEQQQVMET